MKIISALTSVVFVILLISCGQSEEEQAKLKLQQQAREDSIKRAGEEEAKKKFENKQAMQDSLSNVSIQLSIYKRSLMEAKASLEAAKDKMNTIREFQFGRTASERESQIKNQSITISSLEEELAQLIDQTKLAEDKLNRFKSVLQGFN